MIHSGLAFSFASSPLVSGGSTDGPLVWSVTPSLPSGLVLNTTTGIVTGSPAAGTAGSYSYTLAVRDVAGGAGAVPSPCPLTITDQPSVFCPQTLAWDVDFAGYSSVIRAIGGSNPASLVIDIPTGTIPTGLVFTPQTRSISGTPTAIGIFNFTVRATDSLGGTSSATCSITITPFPVAVCPSLQNGEVTVRYSSNLTISGGSGSPTYAIVSGALPQGLTLTPSTGQISGVPTRAQLAVFNITVQDSAGAVSAPVSCSINVIPGPTIACPLQLVATLTTVYGSTLTVANGTGTGYVVTVSGALPSGLVLVGNTIQGVPISLGTYTFALTVTDSAGGVGTSAQCAITVNSPGCLSTGAAPSSCINSLSNTGCTDCPNICRTANPCFSNQCQLNTVLILDNSVSLSPFVPQVRAGILAYVNSLASIVQIGGQASLGVIVFDDGARLAFPMQPVTSAFVANVTNWINTVYLTNMGNTDWASGLILARTTVWPKKVDVFMMFTDGNPGFIDGNLGGQNTGWQCNDACYASSPQPVQGFWTDLCNPSLYPNTACLAQVQGGNFGPLNRPFVGPGLSFEAGSAQNQPGGLWAAARAADLLKQTGSKIFLVGCGDVMLNEDEIEVITGRFRWDGNPTTFFTSDYMISPNLNDLSSLFLQVGQGLCPCLASAPACNGVTTVSGQSSCSATVFSAVVSVSTTKNTVSTTFPPTAVSYANLYYKYLGGSNTQVGWEFITPGTTLATSPRTIVRTDVLNPCQVSRRVNCSGTCYTLQEQQLLPRFFLEASDVLGTTGALNYLPIPGCTGYTKNYPLNVFPPAYSLQKETITYLWVSNSDGLSPCAAEANDGTFFQFFSNGAGTTPGVISPGVAPAALPPNPAGPFVYSSTAGCANRQCAQAVELVFVIDESATLSGSDFSNIRNFVSFMMTNVNVSGSSVGWVWSNSPLNVFSLTKQNAPPPNVIYTDIALQFIQTHPQANGGPRDYAALVTNATNQFWPSAVSTTGLARHLITIVGGADSGSMTDLSRFTAVQDLLKAKNVESWAFGVNVGASQPTLLAQLASVTSYVHYQTFTTSAALVQAQSALATQNCPEGNLCGAQCAGFCSCASPSSCACPVCRTDDKCFTYNCNPLSPNDGCVVNASTYCNDNNACTIDKCDPVVGCVYTVNVTCTPSDKCHTSVCVNATGQCQETLISCDDNNGCTQDSCDLNTGRCSNTNITCTPRTQCESVVCDPAVKTGCVYSSTAFRCITGNKCKDELCDDSQGCVSTTIPFPVSTCFTYTCDPVTGRNAT